MYAGVYGVFGIGYMAYILCNNSIVHGWTGLLPARVVPSGQRVVTSSVLYYTHVSSVYIYSLPCLLCCPHTTIPALGYTGWFPVQWLAHSDHISFRLHSLRPLLCLVSFLTQRQNPALSPATVHHLSIPRLDLNRSETGLQIIHTVIETKEIRGKAD